MYPRTAGSQRPTTALTLLLEDLLALLCPNVTCVLHPHQRWLQMTACAEKDASAMEAKPPQPAIDKLKALGNVGSTLRQRKYHEMFLATKGLNAMAA